VPADADGLRALARRVRGQRVRAVIESMNGARFVHDTLEEEAGWEVLVADAKKVKGLAPLACKTDRIAARVLAELSWRDLLPAIWLPDPTIGRRLARRVRRLRNSRIATLRASPSRRSLRGESGAPGGPASTSAQYPLRSNLGQWRAPS
jgi:hypothetical protein